MSEKPSFFAELKRRHVIRIALAYAVTAWLLIQLGAILLPTFGAPHWVLKALVGVLILLFPVALILAWAFESTPEGVRRTAPAEAEEARPASHGRRAGRVLNVTIIVALVAAVGVLAWRQFGTPSQGTAIPAKSIAVLPFENLSTDKSNGYFADGMQDLILTKLADIGDLKVISRTSTMQYGSHPQNLTKIGKALGVTTLLEGSVQKSGDQVLVNVQLIDARTDNHIWAQSYTRTLKNVFGVEGEVAEKIANALNAKLSPAESQRLASGLSDNPDANLLYLRAEHAFYQFTNIGTPAMKQAIDLYRQALAKAPHFALAHAHLSVAESFLAFQGGDGEDITTLLADARDHANQAMKLAPDQPDSLRAIGYYDYYGKGDFDAALKAFAAALKIRPNDAAVISARGYVLRRQGKYKSAIHALRQALTLDPNSVVIALNVGVTYMALGRYQDAEQSFRNALALHPESTFLLDGYYTCVLYDTGNPEKALAVVQGEASHLKDLRIDALMYQRKYASAIALVESMDSSEKNAFPDEQLAWLYYLSGDKARARKILAKILPKVRARLRAKTGYFNIASDWNDIAGMEIMLGKTREGLASTKAALDASKKTNDRFHAPLVILNAAMNYAQAQRPALAIAMLSRALAMPGIGDRYSPAMLWIDPEWDPIRNTPAFQALLKKYAKYKPATVPTVGSAPAASTAPAS